MVHQLECGAGNLTYTVKTVREQVINLREYLASKRASILSILLGKHRVERFRRSRLCHEVCDSEYGTDISSRRALEALKAILHDDGTWRVDKWIYTSRTSFSVGTEMLIVLCCA